MLDLKALKGALDQLEEERNIPKDKIVAAIEDSLMAAYKKDYGKKGQIIRARLDLDTGQVEFFQIKVVVDDSLLKPDDEPESGPAEVGTESDLRVHFNEEHHIMIDDARKIKKDAALNDEIVFPLEPREDFGRIAAQTAKQVIIQRIREAEKVSILDEYEGKEGDIVSGSVQKMERGNVFVDLGRVTGILPYEEQIRGEYYRQGERVKAYLYQVEETPRGITLRLSRAHPKFVEKLFAIEAPEIASGAVIVKAIAREAGSRTKIAVTSNDHNIDPVGSCVGQRGARVSTVIQELAGEKIDIIEWSDQEEKFLSNALSPAKVTSVLLNQDSRTATVAVGPDQFSLAVGKGGQNVRLAAKLTGWKIDIVTPAGDASSSETEPTSDLSSADNQIN